MMTDDELANYMHLTPPEAAIVIPKLTETTRRMLDRMRQVEIETEAWCKGQGLPPRGVLLDLQRHRKRRRRWP